MKVYICLLCEEDFQIDYGDLYTDIKRKDNQYAAICDDCADKVVTGRLSVLGVETHKRRNS